MPTGFMNIALGLAMQVGTPGPSEMPNFQPPMQAYGQYGFSGSAEQRYPADTQMNWVHGYHQEISAYGGHSVFRPYNYKDVLSQSQTAAGWGERPAMPYSQQYWHKYQDQASMMKISRAQAAPMPFVAGYSQMPQPQTWVTQPSGVQVPNQQIVWPQANHLPVQNSITMPAGMSDTLQAPAIPSSDEATQIIYRR